MSAVLRQYRTLEQRICDLIGEGGAISERVKCLDQMDALWAQMQPHERQLLVAERSIVPLR